MNVDYVGLMNYASILTDNIERHGIQQYSLAGPDCSSFFLLISRHVILDIRR